MSALTHPPHEVFAQHYTTNGYNSHKAAAAAGLHPSAKNHPAVRQRIAELMQAQFAALQLDALAVKEHLARVAFGDIRNLFTPDGDLKPIHELDDDTAACIASIDVEYRSGGQDEEGNKLPPVKVVKVRRHDAMAATKMLAQHFKVIGDDGDGVNALANALADRLHAAKKRILNPEPDPEPPTDVEVVDPGPPLPRYTSLLPPVEAASPTDEDTLW